MKCCRSYRWYSSPLLVLLLLAGRSCAATVYVSINAAGPNPDGASWATAFAQIQAGIDAASPGDEVWVAAGTYAGRITVKEGVSLYGGFAGTESSRSGRDWKSNVCTLDGLRAGSAVTVPDGVTQATVIDGFRIVRGATSGGVQITNASPVISHNTIAYCSANTGGGVLITGGAPSIRDNVFASNSAWYGASIAITNASPRIVNNTFLNNSAQYWNSVSNVWLPGGTVYMSGAEAAPIFINNLEAAGYGFVNDPTSPATPSFSHTCVANNYTATYIGIADPTGTAGNITLAYPLSSGIANAVHPNIHLQPTGPCIDAGDDAAVLDGETDFDGQARIQGAHADIGADEADGTTWSTSPWLLHVNAATGDDGNDGLSWASALKTLQQAQRMLLPQDEVWVAGGRYTGSSIAIPPDVGVYAGFRGDESRRDDRDWRHHPTVLTLSMAQLGYSTDRTPRGQGEINGFAFVGGTISTSNTDTIIRNNTVTGLNTGAGAAIYGSGGAPTIIDNVVRGNATSYGGIVVVDSGGRIADNLVVSNSGSSGGGGIAVRSYSSTKMGAVTIANNTVIGNAAGGTGGGIYLEGPDQRIVVNNIVAFNTAGIVRSTRDATPVTLTANCLYQNTGGDYVNLPSATGLDGNLTADPQFTSLASGDLRLNASSPCVDAGSDVAVLPGDIDMRGNPRIIASHVDIGAYEHAGSDPGVDIRVIRVATTGDDTDDGASWETAKRTVQAGLAALADSGGEVWVAAGTYTEHVTMTTFVSLYGGFAGMETARNQRDPRSNVTVLDAVRQGATVTSTGSVPGTALDGFSIRNGSSSNVLAKAAYIRVSGNTITGAAGPGITCSGGAPVIAGNSIIGNTAAGSGGGVYSSGGASTTIANCLFLGNMAPSGTAVAVNTGALTLINNTIVRNTSTGAGTAVQFSGTSAKMVNNILAFNTNGVAIQGGASLSIRRNCTWNTGVAFSGPALSPADGNIVASPLFASVAGADYHLRPDSPCVDAADDTALLPGESDLEGRVRVIGAHADIGAYESDGTTYPLVAVHVKADGDDAADGLTWATAKKTLAAAFTSQSANPDAEVWVASGTYTGAVSVPNYAALYGGFVGNETLRSQRNWAAHPTVLDGAGSVTTVTMGAAAYAATLDGFTVVNSKPGTLPGLSITGGSPIVRNCTVSGHKVGGIVVSAGSPVLDSCVIAGNTSAGSGAGINLKSQSGTPGTPVVEHCRIFNNKVTGGTGSVYGGGIYCAVGAVIFENMITGNIASSVSTTDKSGGGGLCIASSNAVVARNVITGNRATYAGGGIQCNVGAGNRISDNVISGNYASGGAGISLLSGVSPLLANNTIVGNVAPVSGGAIYAPSGSTLLLTNNVIAHNTLGINAATSNATLSHNLFWDNVDMDVSGIADPVGTNGNIHADPRFASAEYNDLRIQPDSPCRDAGDSAAVADGDKDLAGSTRIQGGGVDIGAFESDGLPLTARVPVVCVTASGNDANDGSSWAAAKRTVQAGVDAAAYQGGGEVWAAAGVYKEAIALRSFVSLLGGFSGVETRRDLRDYHRFASVLDGEAKRRLVTGTQMNFAALDGFVVRNGYASNQDSVSPSGGGIYLAGGLTAIRNNLLIGNQGYSGGALYCNSRAVVSIAGNRFSGNTATFGGGAVYTAQLGSRIADNVFLANNAIYGAAIVSNGSPSIVNNTFVANTASQSYQTAPGATVWVQATAPTNSLFANNIVAFNSSGVRSTGAALDMRFNCAYSNGGSNYVGVTDPSGVNGNIAIDPALRSVAFGDVRLTASSPCLDTGDVSQVLPGETDQDGYPRVAGAANDIGAYEFDASRPPANPVVVRVSNTGDDGSSGSSWSAAKRTIQAAIDLLPLGGQVWVAAGAYHENVKLSAFVSLYGGFGGFEADVAQRNWVFYRTTIDGSSAPGNTVTIPNAASQTAVDGFTITHQAGVAGTGISCLSDARITHNTIRGNTASSSPGTGGGLSVSAASPDVRNNIIVGNRAKLGAGVYWSGGGGTFVGNTLMDNQATNGGGLYAYGSTVTIENSIFASNSSAIYISSSSWSNTNVIRNNCLYGNVKDFEATGDPGLAFGNVRGDPRFLNPTADNYGLRPDSPCRDAGDSDLPEARERDAVGAPRIWGGSVDIGAVEAQDPPLQRTLARVYVRPDGSDIADGSTWGTARRSITAAFRVVRPVRGEVWVAAGTYVECIALPKGIALYGGFAGTESAVDQRVWTANPSVIDANTKGVVVAIPTDAGPSTVLDGFTLTNGLGATGPSGRVGAGVLIDGGAPTLRNLLITGNGAARGSGIYVGPRGAPVIESCRIDANASTGLYATGASILVTGCSISGNVGSGAYLSSSTASFDGCTISGNLGATFGGGIQATDTDLTVSGCFIESNAATNNGGGVYASGGTTTLRGDVFARNTMSASPSTPGNYTLGSAVAFENASADMVNNTVVQNNSPRGAVYVSQSSLRMKNNILAFNGSGIYRRESDTSAVSMFNNCFFENGGLDVSGLTDPVGTNGNIGVDPDLADVLHADFHIQPGSPCRNAGDATAVLAGETDVDGQPRLVDGKVDIGADESDGTVWPEYTTVVRVKPDGDDAADGTSWASAKKTLQAALNAAQRTGGGEVWVKKGTYRECTIPAFVAAYGGFSGTETSRDTRDPMFNVTTIQAALGNSAVTVPAGAMSVGLNGFTLRSDIAGVTFEAGTTGSIVGNRIIGGAHGVDAQYASVLVDRNTITGCGCAVFAGGFGIAEVSRNWITGCYGNTEPTVFISASTGSFHDNLVAGNGGGVARGSGGFGRSRDLGLSGVIVVSSWQMAFTNNTVVGNVNTSASVMASQSNIVAENNLIAFNRCGYANNMTVSSVFRNNLFFANDAGDIAGMDPSPIGRDGNVHADPLLAAVDSGDVHLQPDSPCIDAGDDLVVPQGGSDLDGRPRILGSHVDIGAYESDGSAWTVIRRIIRVKPDGDDTNDGTSWSSAMKTVRAAAESLPPGEVWVAEGTYPDGLFVGPWVSLYGGFAGTEMSRLGRDPSARASELTGPASAPSISVVSGAFRSTVDGFIIRNGGGVVCAASAVDIANNRIEDNAIGVQATDCDLALTANTIVGNSASGVLVTGGTNVVAGNDISNNQGSGLRFSGPGKVLNNRISGNVSPIYGGGIAVENPASALFAGNLIAGNSAAVGGGVWLPTTATTADRTLSAVNNTIVDNTATDSGGAISGLFDVTVNNIVAFNSSGISTTGAQGDARNNCIYGNAQYNFAGLAPYDYRKGNIVVDPLFAARSASNYQLAPGSPCIDHGDDSVLTQGEVDLDGKPRRLGTHADMGAYEYTVTGYYSLADAAQALRVAGGLIPIDAANMSRLNVVAAPPSINVVDILDAISIAMKADGLDSNP